METAFGKKKISCERNNKIFFAKADSNCTGRENESMGLFSNNKKLCPVCGAPTPRLFPTKVEGTPVCKECAGKIFLPDGMLDSMTMGSFMQYMNYYGENQSLRERFTATYSFHLGASNIDILLDTTNRLFRLSVDERALVMEASCLKSFRILEGDNLLFESLGNGLRCYDSNVAEKVRGMAGLIEQFKSRRDEYQFRQQMERRREEEAKRRGEEYRKEYMSEPTFRGYEPFDRFRVELLMEHPYWSEISGEMYGPTFDSRYPSIDSYICDYQNEAEKMHELAMNLMQFISPGAGEVRNANEAAAFAATQAPTRAAGNSAIEEIKQYKELLDAGIITEEEFAMKKRQLLGL